MCRRPAADIWHNIDELKRIHEDNVEEAAAAEEAAYPSLVPEPVHVGADGLKEVSKSAKSALKAAKKQAFRRQFKKQEMHNLAVMAQNSKIVSEILQLESRNLDFQIRADGLLHKNHMLRSEMHKMEVTLKQYKLGDADRYHNDKDEDIPKQLSQAEYQARHDKWKASFKAWFKVRNEAAAPIVDPPVDKISREEIFIRDFSEGALRHKALMALQKSLIERRGGAQALEQRLQKSLAHLRATHLQLTHRIGGEAQALQQRLQVWSSSTKLIAEHNEDQALMQQLQKAMKQLLTAAQDTDVQLEKHAEQLPKPLV